MAPRPLHRSVIAKSAFRLLDLPPELRNNIYRYVIEKFERKAKHKRRRVRIVRGVISQLPRAITNFLLSCKTIWRELLSLLFGSYTWTADLRIRNLEAGAMEILPVDGWLHSQSTWRQPVSGNIRHISFKMDHKACSRRHPGVSPGWWFEIVVDLTELAPYFVTKVWSHISNSPYLNPPKAKLTAFAADLETTVRESLAQLTNIKSASRESITSITIEEWHDVAMNLRATYLLCVRKGI